MNALTPIYLNLGIGPTIYTLTPSHGRGYIIVHPYSNPIKIQAHPERTGAPKGARPHKPPADVVLRILEALTWFDVNVAVYGGRAAHLDLKARVLDNLNSYYMGPDES